MVTMSELTAVVKLMRLKMVFISGITYATGASMAMRLTPGSEMDVTLFALGYAFIFSCQMVAHFFGEYYDLPSDTLNSQSSGSTGGSKVLVRKEIAPIVAMLIGQYSLLLCATLLGVIMCWCIPPPGGSDNTTMNRIYVIWLLGFIMMTVSYQYSGPPFKLNHNGLGELCASCVMNVLLPWFAALIQAPALINPVPLAPLIVPGFLLKFVLLLTLNVEDRRADWHSGKNTLAVLIGDEMSGKLQFYFTVGAYASAVVLNRLGMAKPSTLALLLVSAPLNVNIALKYNSPDRPYRMDATIIRKVLIVGGGMGGLVLAATLSRLNIPYKLFERREVEKNEDYGVDLAVWPAATRILQELGVASGLWPQAGQSFPVHTMYISALDGNGTEHDLKRLNMKAICASTGECLRLVARRVLIEDLRLVVPDYKKSTGKNVQSIREGDENLSVELHLYGSSDNPVRGRVLVGCDGVGSLCRTHVTRNRIISIRQCGEVCYRGTIDLRQGCPGSRFAYIFAERDRCRPWSMTVTYGDGIRFSWGYLDESRKTGYWFVKQLLVGGTTEPPPLPSLYNTWPEPIRTFAKHCGNNVYMHPILDLPYLEKWSCGHVTLLGDACHAVTANSGQGANMAIEDAFVLGLLLRKYWGEPDGHIEAFYQYERERKPYATRITKEAQKILRLGQLIRPWAIYLRNIFLKLMPVKVVENKIQETNLCSIDKWIRMYRIMVAKEE